MERELNFAAIFGNASAVAQVNTQNASNRGMGLLNQTAENIAYTYGALNSLSQSQAENATALVNTTANINQTRVNMGFLISRNMPANSTFVIPPGANMTMPTFNITQPVVPSPPSFNITFPMTSVPSINSLRDP